MTSNEDERTGDEPSVIRRRFTRFADAEAFLAERFDPVTIRPIGPDFRVSSTLLALGDLRIWSVRTGTGFESFPGERPSRYWMCFPAYGRQDVRFDDATVAIREGEGWVAASDRIVGLRKHPGLLETSFDIPRAVVDDYLGRSLEFEPRPLPGVGRRVDMTRAPGRVIAKLVSGMLEGVDDGSSLHFSPVAAQNFSNFILDLVVHGIFAGADVASRHKHGLGDRSALQNALDFIEANLQLSMTILDIAHASGIGPRALQATFLRRFGCSPLRYVRGLRLARVRAELLDEANQDGIAVVAARWGFFHLGLFARQYREAFGELPSQTRRK